MKDDRKKIKEPFEPDETPKPPQQVDPATSQKRDDALDEKETKQDQPQNKQTGQSGKQHLLDEDTDIDDETTI